MLFAFTERLKTRCEMLFAFTERSKTQCKMLSVFSERLKTRCIEHFIKQFFLYANEKRYSKRDFFLFTPVFAVSYHEKVAHRSLKRPKNAANNLPRREYFFISSLKLCSSMNVSFSQS